MKTIILFAMILLGISSTISAQKNKPALSPTQKETTSGKKAPGKTNGKTEPAINKLISLNNSNALSPARIKYKIDDPVILGMNKQANGFNAPVNIGIGAMPKGTYGLANGHIILIPDD